MELEVSQISCRCCGAAVSSVAGSCEYCGNPIRITTLKSAADLSKPILMKYAKAYEEGEQNGEDADFALGLIFLRLGQYEKAKSSFSNSISKNPVQAESYFYSAVAELEGKKPFLCKRKVIDEVLSHIRAAQELENQPMYTYFSAIVKYDYFDRKGFKIEPNYVDELNESLEQGVASGDADVLLGILNVKLPDSFIINGS